MCCLAHRLARRSVVAPHPRKVKANCVERTLAPKIDNRLEPYVELVEVARQEVGWLKPLAGGCSCELPIHGFTVQSEIQRTKTLRGVPATTMDPRAGCGQRIMTRSDVSKRSSFKVPRTKAV